MRSHPLGDIVKCCKSTLRTVNGALLMARYGCKRYGSSMIEDNLCDLFDMRIVSFSWLRGILDLV